MLRVCHRRFSSLLFSSLLFSSLLFSSLLLPETRVFANGLEKAKASVNIKFGKHVEVYVRLALEQALPDALPPTRSFRENLMLRMGEPVPEHLIDSAYWRRFAKEFGGATVRGWLDEPSFTIRSYQLEWLVGYFYNQSGLSDRDPYLWGQLLRHWRASAGFSEPDSYPDQQLVGDLAEHRDLIVERKYEVVSSRAMMHDALEQAKLPGLSHSRPAELLVALSIDHSPSGEFKFALVPRTLDLIVRHLAGEFVVDQAIIKSFFIALDVHTDYGSQIDLWALRDKVDNAIVFERLLHRYQLAKKANHDLSEVDPKIREVLDLY